MLYLVVVITGIFSLMYVPKSLIVWDNSTTTFNNIVSNQTLFRLGLVSGLICYTFFLFLPLVLYKLFEPVNYNYAKLMVLLAVVSVPIYFINVQNQFTILSLVSSSNYLNGFSTEQTKSMVMLYLDQYENGMRIIHIFSGLWLFPFGYLVFKSGFLPKFLGILLMLGCFGYLINFIGNTLVSNYSEIGIASYIQLPASLGEIGICLWLLIMGAKESKTSNYKL
ncbi:DUF4386 domain-containing protein [Mariniflexile sp.]|uniref:DUF4386 domain-containing protein n=1 Tax=Mariniflexile sp. TaxID=1979402 RepID=UPI0040471204